ncbi:hypothetical protein AGOR_G00049260 [Albula goreensis]|uniref:Uncharacterized protein n=1 Tax=Albula goreensis TaxID=1534307 RepID=A0A8T3DVI2_9TELE|nr:hypothetical protein AGOR_G00049260 [Albula goreensis]
MSSYKNKMEDEAVLDRGASFLKHVCDEEEVEGHHTFYIGVHVPKSYRRRRRHRRRAGHKDRKEKVTENASDKSDAENNDEASNSILKPLSKCSKIHVTLDYRPGRLRPPKRRPGSLCCKRPCGDPAKGNADST